MREEGKGEGGGGKVREEGKGERRGIFVLTQALSRIHKPYSFKWTKVYFCMQT